MASTQNIGIPTYILEFFYLFQRESISREYLKHTREENMQLCEVLARQSLFTMKLAHSPFFRAQIVSLILQNEDAWRAIRKEFRDLAPKMRACRDYPIRKDYFTVLQPHLIAQAHVQASNFVTWGNVMFDTPLQMKGPNGRFLTNLLGYCQENGHLSMILPTMSVILELLVQKSLDFKAFGSFESDDELADFFMRHKIRYTLENLKQPVEDWLFTSRGEETGVLAIHDLIDQVFRTHFSQEIQNICEILEDSAGLNSHKFSSEDYRDLTSVILQIFWQTLPVPEQLTILNQWPHPRYLYELLSSARCTYDQVREILEILQDLQYGSLTQNFLVESQASLEARFGKEKQRELTKNISKSTSLVTEESLAASARTHFMGDLDQTKHLLDEVRTEGVELLDEEEGLYYWGLQAHLSSNLQQWEDARKYFLRLLEQGKEGKVFFQTRLVFLFLCSGDESTFLSEFEEVTKKLSFTTDTMIPEMRDLYRDFILVKGIDFMNQLLEKVLSRGFVDGPSICIDFGHMVADLGFDIEGITFFKRGLTLNPTPKDEAALLNNIGSILTETGKVRDAIPYFEEAIRLNPANGRTYLNLGKAYEFLGDPLKARAILQLAQEKTTSNNPSPGELICTTIETASMKELDSFVINYNALKDSDVKTQFKLGDRLFTEVFPQVTGLQELATSILSHYGNGMELLFHLHLGLKFLPLIQQQIASKRPVPKSLEGLIRGDHVGLGGWTRILTTFIKNPAGGQYRQYKKIISRYKGLELRQLRDAAKTVKDWRNPSSHADIIDFATVKRVRRKIILAINQCIEIFSRSEKSGGRPISPSIR